MRLPSVRRHLSFATQLRNQRRMRRACVKAAGLMIGMPWKPSRTSRSASPDTITLAWPFTANSRNLLSFGSRHPVMRCVMLTNFGGGEHGAQVVEKGWRNLAGNARPL